MAMKTKIGYGNKADIDTAIGSSGADVGSQIEKAKSEVIQQRKAYTDAALTITEF